MNFIDLTNDSDDDAFMVSSSSNLSKGMTNNVKAEREPDVVDITENGSSSSFSGGNKRPVVDDDDEIIPIVPPPKKVVHNAAET
jgi:hypothetical protein